MFGDGSTQAGVSAISRRVGARPVLAHRHDGEVAAEALRRVRPPRELAGRHSVADGHRMEAHERQQPLLRQVSLDDLAAERVRPVEDDDGNPPLRALPHDERDRPDERVVAAADVRQVADDGVEPLEVLVLGGEVVERLAVEGNDGKARGLPRRDRLHVLRGAREAVLRTEEDAHVEAGAEQRLRCGNEAERDGCRVAKEAEALAREKRKRTGGFLLEYAGRGLGPGFGGTARRHARFTRQKKIQPRLEPGSPLARGRVGTHVPSVPAGKRSRRARKPADLSPIPPVAYSG